MKKIITFLILILFFVSILHIFWYLKIWINYFTWLSKIYQWKELDVKKEVKILENLKKEKNYNKNLLEFDLKVNSFFNYYLKRNDCYKTIKDYTNFDNPTNKWLNVDFVSIQKGNDVLQNIIKCNIYNSISNDIYIRIPYSYLLKKTSTLKIKNFILQYQNKWYNIHLIYIISWKEIRHNKNVFSFISNKKIKSLSFYHYNHKNFTEAYERLKRIEQFYIINYWKYKIDINIGLDSNNKLLWLKRENLMKPNQINKKMFVEYNNEYLKTKTLSQFYKEIKEIGEYVTKNDILLINFSFNKEKVDKIDWLDVYKKLSKSNIMLSIPNSIILSDSRDLNEKEFEKKIKKKYSNKLTEKDMLIIFYKYKINYLEKINKNR